MPIMIPGIILILAAGIAGAADIELEPPPGGAVSITDDATPRMRIHRDGRVEIPGLGGAATEDAPVCFDADTGQLGGCTVVEEPPTVVGDASLILVNSLDDDVDPTDGNCTLREAIGNANNAADTAPGASGECATGDNSSGTTRIDMRFLVGSIKLSSALPAVDAHAVLQGPGQDLLTIDGADSFRVLEIAPGNTVVVEKLSLSNGRSELGDGMIIAEGGGIAIFGPSPDANRVILRDLTISNNEAPGGGGIYVDSGAQVEILRCSITGNTGSMGGAGLLITGDAAAWVEDSRFSGNTSATGGVIFVDTVSWLRARGNTFIDNAATAIESIGTSFLMQNYFESNSIHVLRSDGTLFLVGNVFWISSNGTRLVGGASAGEGNLPAGCNTGSC